jgi:signal transduction histidine kinase
MPTSLVGQRIKNDQDPHAVLALTSGRIVAVDDIFQDDVVNHNHMRRHSIRSVMVVPLKVRNEAIGVIFFNYHSAKHHFTETEIDFARQMAFIAGIALANAQLYEAHKSAEDQVRGVNRQLEQRVAERTKEIEKQYKTLEKLNTIIKQLSKKTIAAIENDRKALSKEIHDNIGGSLSAIKMMLETRYGSSSKRTDREIIRHLADTIKETKRISFQMRSLALGEFGLQAAIVENIKIFKSFHPNIAVDFQVDISPDTLPEEITLVIYRVVQEGLDNVGKHSGANEVKIVLNELKEHIYIEIKDNGHGLDPSDEPVGCREAIQHLGIHSIKERVEICDGTFQMDAIPGRGTRLRVFIPKKF